MRFWAALVAAGVPAALLAASVIAGPAAARTLAVGEGKEFPLPSAAIDAAQDGDTVLIEPGQYFDCAIVRHNGLTIAGNGGTVEITDKACEGKALLVIRADHVTVRDLTLARARVPDGNGAGIRLEGPNLLVQHVTFDNDQVGILSGTEGGEVRIEACVFENGGVGGDRPKYAVMAGRSALLRIERSIFRDVKGGQIMTAATRTEVVGNTIGDGTGDDPAEAVLATDGALLLEDNTIALGPNVPRREAAVALWDDATGTIRRNKVVNQTGQRITLLLDWSSGTPVLESNEIGKGDRLETSSGVWRHRASTQFYARKAEARALAGQLKRAVVGLWR